MKQTLESLVQGNTLTRTEAKEILLQITSGKFSNEEIAAFLMAQRMRPLYAQEVLGFRDAMLEQALHIDLSDWQTIDIVGTGGDGKNSFNISTCTAVVVAGAGYKVAKHGSYGVSSVSGSANVLMKLGVSFTTNEDTLHRCLDQANICFLHAPLFHPTMKYVVPVRKALKIKTIFNILGPLLNPTNSKYGLYGVSEPKFADVYHEVLQQTEINYHVVHNMDGYDEISLTDKCLVINREEKKYLTAPEFDLHTIEPKTIFGGSSVDEAAEIFLSVLENRSTGEQQNVVLANAALAINTIEPAQSLTHCVEIAKESLHSGKARQCLQQLVDLTQK